MRLYLITHPSVNIDPHVPVNQWNISASGWAAVQRFKSHPIWHSVQVVFASTEPKASSAADFWARHLGLSTNIVPGLEEIDRTATGFIPEPQHTQQVINFYRYPNKHINGWESAHECLVRIKQSLDKIIKSNHNKNIAVVSHGAVTNLYVCDLKKITATPDTGQPELGSWTIIDPISNRVLTEWQKY